MNKPLLFLTSIYNRDNTPKPVRLEKPKKKTPKIVSNLDIKAIIFILLFIFGFILITYYIFQTGSLESTRMYNNRLASYITINMLKNIIAII